MSFPSIQNLGKNITLTKVSASDLLYNLQASSICLAALKGEVGWSSTTFSNCRSFLSKKSTNSNNTDNMPALSEEVFLERRYGTSAPFSIATSAISGESVSTYILSMLLHSAASRMVCTISGLPENFFKFFPGNRLEPFLAGMTAINLSFSCCSNLVAHTSII